MRAKEKRIAAKRLPILLWKTSDSSWIDVAKVAEKIREHKKLTSAEREVKQDFWKPILAALKEEHQKRKK